MNEEALILYYYDDGLSDRERQRIAAALEADPDLAAEYQALCRDLDRLSDVSDVNVPSHVIQRMHDSIDRVARPVTVEQVRPTRSFNPLSFAWGAAVTAALAIGIGIGVYFSDDPIATPETFSDPFTRGMQVYLRDARDGIATMPVTGMDDRAQLVMQIIEQNRLFERAAVQNHSDDLARVLRAFEPILLKLASEDITPAEAEALRAQLTFELNVMLTKISRGSSNETQTT